MVIKMFKWALSRTTKLLGRKVDTTFFSSVYREIFKELNEIFKNETNSSKMMKQLGIKAAYESANRQSSLLKMFPNDPAKILGYLDIIWQTIFGSEMEDFECIEQINQESNLPIFIYRINKCPICGGYGTVPEDSFDCRKIEENESKFAAGLIGMIEETANFILTIKGNDNRVKITETKCFCRGDNYMELFCEVISAENFENLVEIPIVPKTSSTFNVDFDEIEKLLSKPLDAIKEKVSDLIEQKMQMTPEELFDHFRNYEADVVRIIGFFIIHLLNENGRLFERAVKNETTAKIIGILFNTFVEMTTIYIPKEIIADYQSLFVEFLTGLAPQEMVESFKRFEVSEILTLFFEGMEKAMQDLGINLENRKDISNIWEELEKNNNNENNLVNVSSDKDISEEEKKQLTELRISVIQEIFLLLNVLISLPSRILISSIHGAIKSSLTSGEEIFENLRNHTEILLDLLERLKK